jgi:hypothetical protein
MSSERQMQRGKYQAMYKYLPDSWIDFSVRGKYRNQFIAHVERWNSENIEGINKKRLLRKVSSLVNAFAQQGAGASAIPATSGFGAELTLENCSILTPKVSENERAIVATISPLTFYCKKCMKIHTFKSEFVYRKYPKCQACAGELAQLRQIYFCKCGYATDKHYAKCSVHGYENIKWDGEYSFYCAKCNRKIPMRVRCQSCGQELGPKVALDPSQFFTFSTNLIDMIDETTENFIAETDYGKYIVIAYWLGKISYDELFDIIKNGIKTDESEYQKIYDAKFKQFMDVFKNEALAAMAAKSETDMQCGSKYTQIIENIKAEIIISDDNLKKISESILEFIMVKTQTEIVTIQDAIQVSKLLNTSANPEKYIQMSEHYGISNIQACDNIPFISSSYGFTRVKNEYESGVTLHALKQEKNGQKNIYAVKMQTEGVLFEFDKKKIIQWLINNDIITESQAPDINSIEEVELWFVNNIHLDCIQPFIPIDEIQETITSYVYRLIHSLSHVLIRAVADIGGLGKDSLSEYLFPGVPATLIYCQNSQGFSLGSLTNAFEAYLDLWLTKANQISQKCVFDPICLERDKACTGCIFLNEISCEHFNKDLDRSLLIGHLDNVKKRKIIGFWEE